MVRGTTRRTPKIQEHLHASIHNRFDIEVIDASTGEVKQKAKALNTICNQLWTRLLANSAYFVYIHYGTGSGSPSSSDTSLFTFLGYDTATLSNWNYDPVNGIFSMRKYIRLSASTAVGKTLTEVGIAYDKTASTLCTHAMLEDMNGNRVSITKSDTDVINIYATVYVHFAGNGYDNGTIHLLEPNVSNNPTRYGIFGWLVGHNDRSGIPCHVYGSRYHNSRSISASKGSYISSTENKTVTITATRMESTDNNVGGLVELCAYANLWVSGTGLSSSYTYDPYLVFLIGGGSWFPYSEIVNEAVGTGDGSKTEFALDFPYAHDATIYVDGQPVSAEVQYGSNLTEVAKTVLWLNPESTAGSKSLNRYINSTSNYPAIFENPAYRAYGLATVYGYNSTSKIYASNDLSTWVTIGTGMSVSVPSEYQHYRYWKSSYTFGSNVGVFNNTNLNVVKLAEAPASGSVITADYKCDCIAKNANNVFDFSCTIHLGEYVEG